MLRNVEVVYYHLAFGKKGSKPEPKHEEAIEKLLNGQFHSGMSHTIHYSTPFYVRSISYGGKPRLLYTLKRFEQKTYCIITEDLAEHDYLDADTERSTGLRDCLSDFKTSLEQGKFIPIPRKEEKEEKEEENNNDYFTDGKFIQFMPIQSGIISGPLPQYNFGAAGAGKTLTDMARLEKEFDEGHDVLYITQRSELAATERHRRDRKYILSKDDDAPNFAVLDYDAMIRLIDPTLEKKKMVGEVEFNTWVNEYLKHQKTPENVLSRKHQIYKELRNISGYSKEEYLEELGQKECLFHEVDEKIFLWQIYKSYKKELELRDAYDPSFYEIKDFSLFQDHIVAIDEVDNLSTLQIMQLMRFANFKDIMITGDGHQRDDDLLPKRPFIKRRLGSHCKDTALDESKRCGKVIIEFANKLINVKYDVTGGKTEKDEYEEIKIPVGQHEGSFAWRDDWNDDDGVSMCQSLQEKYGKEDLYVITHPNYVDDARKKFPGNTVYTFQQSKGREFKHVVLYRPFDTDDFAAADDILASKEPSEKKTKRHMPKKGERDNLNFAPAFNQIFVGCTRAIESLTICQRDDKKSYAVRNVIKRLRPAAAMNKDKAVLQKEEKEKKVEVKEDPEARLKKAIKLLMNGDESQAKQEREYLSEDQQKKYDAFKIEFDATREREKEEELKRQADRREKMRREKQGQGEIKSAPTKRNAAAPDIAPKQSVATSSPASKLDAPSTSKDAHPGDKKPVKGTPATSYKVTELKSPQLSSATKGSIEDLQKKSISQLDATAADHMLKDLKRLFAQADTNPEPLYKCIELSSGSEQRCSVLAKFHKENPEFLSSIPPEIMFRFYKTMVAGEFESETTIFNNILIAHDDNYELLSDWLSYDTWVSYVADIYKTQSAEYLINFTLKIINPLLYHWSSQDEPPFLRLLMHEPLFLSKIAEFGFFAVNQAKNISIFALLCTNANFHPFLIKLFDNKPELISQIDFDEFFEVRGEESGPDEFPPVLHLSRTGEGRQLLLSMLKARPEFLSYLSSAGVLFRVYPAPDVNMIPCLTCVYKTLEGTVEGDEIIELLKKSNPALTTENIRFEISNNGLDFLNEKEIKKVNHLKIDLTVESLATLMRDPDAKRLLFKTSGMAKAEPLFIKLLSKPHSSEILFETLQKYPDLIKNAIPVTIFNATVNCAGMQISYLYLLLDFSYFRKITKILFDHDDLVNSIEPKVLFGLTENYGSLLEFLLHDDKLHWVLCKLFENADFAYRFIKEFGDHSLSKKDIFSKVTTLFCRYYPVLAAHLANLAYLKKLKELTPTSVIFGDPKLAAPNFSYLARHPTLHSSMALWIESDPAVLDRIPAVLLGLAIDPTNKDETQTPLSCLAQTEAGRKIIRAYVRNPVRAKSLATSRLLLTPIKSQNQRLNGQTVVDLLQAADGPGSDIVRVVVAANSDFAKAMIDFVLANAGPRLDKGDSPKRTQRSVSPGLDTERENIVQEFLETSDAELLFSPDENNGCIFITMSRLQSFIRNLMEAFKSNRELFKGIPVSTLFYNYHAPDVSNKTKTIIAIMAENTELYDLLVFILSDLKESDVALLIAELHKELKVNSEGNTTTHLSQLSLRLPSLLLFLQDKYPAFAASFTASNMTVARVLNSQLVLSFLETQSITADGCEFLDRQVRLNKTSITDIPPAAMFRLHDLSDGKSKMTTTAFNNILRLQKEHSQVLTCWLENDAWMDYMIDMYMSKSRNNLEFFTASVIRDLIYYWRFSENPPILRLLQKCPDFLLLLPNNIFTRTNEQASVFELLCANPLYHPYLSDHKTWGDFRQLDINNCLQSMHLEPNVPFNLSQSKKGLGVLGIILVLRPEIRKRLATEDELFRRVKFPQAPDRRPYTCLYKMLNQSAKGKEIIELLRQTNPKLTSEFLDQSLKRSSLDFLTDEECLIVDKVRNDLTSANLVSLMRRSDAQRLLFNSSGLDLHMSFIIDMLLVDTAALCSACELYPELIKVFPTDFLMRAITLNTVQSGTYLKLMFAKLTARKFLKILAPHHEYFTQINFEFLLDNGNTTTHLTYFEEVLFDRKLHFLLFQMIENSDKAQSFVAKYCDAKLSEGAAFSMVCKYCPEFALALAEKVLPRIQTVSLFFDLKDLVPMHFYWLARHLPAHEKLYSTFSSYPHLLTSITLNNLRRALPEPFPPNEASSPLDALVQTPHGKKILQLIKNAPKQKKEMISLIDGRLSATAQISTSPSMGSKKK